MNWTPAKRKAHGEKIRAAWAKKRAQQVEAFAEVLATDDGLAGMTFAEMNALRRGAARPTYCKLIPDTVNAPPHYTFGKYEVIDVLEDWFPTDPLLWQVGKYIARWDKKGDPLENLKKAEYYLQRKIKQLEGK